MELISREMAIDHMRVLGGEDRERLMRILNNKYILPTIESRTIGKWEDNAIGYSCNLCGRTHIIKDNYCPCCGAYMVEDMGGE